MREFVRVTKSFTFDMAHALYGYDGPCKNIHGHTYKLFVTLKGKPLNKNNDPKNGMLIDFSDVKECVKQNILNDFDHALVLFKHSPHGKLDKKLGEQFEKIIYLKHQPTCENLLLHFYNILKPLFKREPKLVYLRLEETPTSYAEWYASDNE